MNKAAGGDASSPWVTLQHGAGARGPPALRGSPRSMELGHGAQAEQGSAAINPSKHPVKRWGAEGVGRKWGVMGWPSGEMV